VLYEGVRDVRKFCCMKLTLQVPLARWNFDGKQRLKWVRVVCFTLLFFSSVFTMFNTIKEFLRCYWKQKSLCLCKYMKSHEFCIIFIENVRITLADKINRLLFLYILLQLLLMKRCLLFW
jgi:hypothetical protein